MAPDGYIAMDDNFGKIWFKHGNPQETGILINRIVKIGKIQADGKGTSFPVWIEWIKGPIACNYDTVEAAMSARNRLIAMIEQEG